MCYHSNGMFVCFQPEGRSTTKNSATQMEEEAMAGGQEIHWLRQVALVSKTSYLKFECCLPYCGCNVIITVTVSCLAATMIGGYTSADIIS